MSKVFAFLLVFGLYTATPQAAQLVSDLSTNEVAIETNFTGENILLFGAIEKNREIQQDIIVIIKGPPQALTVRRKEKHYGIWVNGSQRRFASAPSYYAIASTRRLDRITIPAELERHAAGLKFLPVTFYDASSPSEDDMAFVTGLIRNKLATGLYNENTRGVKLIDGQLFRAEIALPPSTPVGVYQARILLFENGVLTGQQINRINVGIGDLEQLLHSWAFERPVLYGIVGVIISIVCGWGTAVAFRRRA